MEIQPTDWFALDKYAPVRDGWYEVQLVSGDTAFAKYGDGEWTEKPLLVFTHWRGLSADHTSIVEATLARDAEKACAGLHAHIQDTARVAEAAIFGAAKGRDPLPAS